MVGRAGESLHRLVRLPNGECAAGARAFDQEGVTHQPMGGLQVSTHAPECAVELEELPRVRHSKARRDALHRFSPSCWKHPGNFAVAIKLERCRMSEARPA